MLVKIFAGLVLFEIIHVLTAAFLSFIFGKEEFKFLYLLEGAMLASGTILMFIAEWCIDILAG